MSSTLAEKIIARASGDRRAVPGQTVEVSVDLLMAHDSSGPRHWRPKLEALGAGLWDPAKVVIVSDHFSPAADVRAAGILKLTREFVTDYGVEHFYDMQGICHSILPERGHVRPGMFVAGGDSHTPMAGAFGCYAAGFGATDTTAIAATGRTWLTVPETIRVEITGMLGRRVTAKDIMLRLCRELGMNNNFKVVEYCGSAVNSMSMGERTVLSNMAAELGAETGLIGVDETTIEALRSVGVVDERAKYWKSDHDAEFAQSLTLNIDELAPQIAAPLTPENSDDVNAFEGISIDQCYIGACVGAKIEDLRMATTILKGRKVADGTRLLIAPSTSRVTSIAASEGVLSSLVDAGATILPSGCGACAGFGAGVLAEGETCLSTTNRNFKGRMGHPSASVYLGSAYSVAACAVAGKIIDPRRVASPARWVK